MLLEASRWKDASLEAALLCLKVTSRVRGFPLLLLLPSLHDCISHQHHPLA